MRFSSSEWTSVATRVLSRLTIGSYCVICGRAASGEIDLCDDCESLFQCCRQRNRLAWSNDLCLACGRELSSVRNLDGEHKRQQCTECDGSEQPFSRIIAPYRYDYPVDCLIQQLKYHDRRVLARVFGHLLARAVGQDAMDTVQARQLPTVLLPVPIHANRRRERGYNQSAEIARWCARQLRLVCREQWVLRNFDSGSLAGLSRAERQYRILGAFRANERVAGCRVAIVDDVLTTGSTAREMARELYDTGVLDVELWVLARTSNERRVG